MYFGAIFFERMPYEHHCSSFVLASSRPCFVLSPTYEGMNKYYYYYIILNKCMLEKKRKKKKYFFFVETYKIRQFSTIVLARTVYRTKDLQKISFTLFLYEEVIHEKWVISELYVEIRPTMKFFTISFSVTKIWWQISYSDSASQKNVRIRGNQNNPKNFHV